jgi:hypothetical protein
MLHTPPFHSREQIDVWGTPTEATRSTMVPSELSLGRMVGTLLSDFHRIRSPYVDDPDPSGPKESRKRDCIDTIFGLGQTRKRKTAESNRAYTVETHYRHISGHPAFRP